MDHDRIAALLDLEPLPSEGGMFRRTFAHKHSSAIYFLIRSGDETMFHRVPGVEVFHHYLGATAEILILEEAGGLAVSRMGPDLEAAERPQLVVPGGAWQAARTTGDWTLMGTTVSPPFEWEGFEIATREELLSRWPEAREEIIRHTRAGAGSWPR